MVYSIGGQDPTVFLRDVAVCRISGAVSFLPAFAKHTATVGASRGSAPLSSLLLTDLSNHPGSA